MRCGRRMSNRWSFFFGEFVNSIFACLSFKWKLFIVSSTNCGRPAQQSGVGLRRQRGSFLPIMLSLCSEVEDLKGKLAAQSSPQGQVKCSPPAFELREAMELQKREEEVAELKRCCSSLFSSIATMVLRSGAACFVLRRLKHQGFATYGAIILVLGGHKEPAVGGSGRAP